MTKEKPVIVEGLKVDAISTVGAGDAMVAAWALSFYKGYSLEKSVILATAASTAIVMISGTVSGKLHTIKQLEERVRFRYV